VKLITRPLHLARIVFILMRYNIDAIVLGKHWFYPFRLAVYFNPYYWTSVRNQSEAIRIRCAIEELGPIFVKAGQIASTRRDLIPDDIAVELAMLQDRVPPFSGKKAKAIIEKTLKMPIDNVFSEFETVALASASIAQVHAARLKTGEEVVVKVLRQILNQL
jgi:ubiquinone biosynthesis protein